MLFIELRFLVFFAVVFGGYWALPGGRGRKLWLLGASYLFYAAWDWRFLSLIWLSTTMDYGFGRLLIKRRRRSIVVASVLANLAVLVTFKYYDFFAGSAQTLLAWGGVRVDPHLLAVVLPAGISFYTFESISYTVNVYRGESPATSLLDFALFLAFFPHLLAGPILRPAEFLPQLDQPRRFASVDVRGALVLFWRGFFKKACLADGLAQPIDAYFAAPAGYTAGAAWMAAFTYAVQVYCDFSGYTDMGRGLARLLGFELVENFDFPLFSSSFREFWRRWHMSLSRWLRDYLYRPLRAAGTPRALGLFLTMALCGLWHGAAWRFVLWGALHGVFLLVEEPLQRIGWPRRGRALLGNLLVFTGFAVSLMLYHVVSWDNFRVTLRQLLWLRSPGQATFSARVAIVLVVLVAVHKAGQLGLWREWWRRLPAPLFASLLGAEAALIFAFMQLGYRPFIYFQF